MLYAAGAARRIFKRIFFDMKKDFKTWKQKRVETKDFGENN